MAANPYELQRQRVKSDSQNASVEQTDALKRRFARMGGLNSGAYLKSSERLAGQQEQNQQKALEGVDIQESLAAEQKAEAERGRGFSREERLGSQEFASGESALGRRFVSEESSKGREFQAGESKLGREFQAGESKLGRDQQAQQFGASLAEQINTRQQQGEQFKSSLGEQKATRLQQADQFGDQMDLSRDQFENSKVQFGSQMELANKQFKLDTKVSEFNMDMANKIFNKKDPMEQALDPMGTSKIFGGWGDKLSGNSQTKNTAIGTVAGGVFGGVGGYYS
jgi:hypothetical protein